MNFEEHDKKVYRMRNDMKEYDRRTGGDDFRSVLLALVDMKDSVNKLSGKVDVAINDIGWLKGAVTKIETSLAVKVDVKDCVKVTQQEEIQTLSNDVNKAKGAVNLLIILLPISITLTGIIVTVFIKIF